MSTKKYQPPKEVQDEHSEFFKKIGEKLKAIREENDVSVYKLSKEMGVSRNAYPKMEDGEIYFNTLTLLRVLDYFNIDPADFFCELNKD